MILMVLVILLFLLLFGFIAGMPIYLVCRSMTSNPADNEEEKQRRRRRLARVYWPIWLALWVVGIGLLPARGRPREAALRANCLSNLKQLGLAIAMYADNDPLHRCPTDGNPPTLVGSLRLLDKNKVSNAKILSCPSDRDRHPEVDFARLTTNNISYSYVPNLIWNPDHADSIVALDRISDTAGGSQWSRTGNHKGTGGNVLFGDGHVAWVNALPSTLKDKDGKEVVLSP